MFKNCNSASINSCQWSLPILFWYDQHRRDLPWRETPINPYWVWLSEMMLQQTTVKTVLPYFQKFIDSFPTVFDLAKASLQEILTLWQGLGYYRRANYLYQGAIKISNQGYLPRTPEEWFSLPGVGHYTGAAISAFVWDLPFAAVDSNIFRIFSRFFGIQGEKWKTQVTFYAKELLPDKRCGDYTQALMDLGATICTPRSPKCHLCPVQKKCFAFMHNQQEKFPPKIQRIKRVRKGYVLGLFSLCGEYVRVCDAPPHGLLNGLWGFPTSSWIEQEHNEEKRNSVNFLECLNGQTEHFYPDISKNLIGEVRHIFTHFTLYLDVYVAFSSTKSLKNLPGTRWILKNQITSLPFSTLMRKVQALLLGHSLLKT